MKKIISLFKRDYEVNSQVINEVVEGAEWVVKGEGVATVKLDGICCMIKNGVLYERYDVNKGMEVPEGFMPPQWTDETTGRWHGWIIVDFNDPSKKPHLEAYDKHMLENNLHVDGTFELCGEKISGNPELINGHILIRHGSIIIKPDPPREFCSLRNWIIYKNIEGLVWHHPDGRMVKIKKEDFGSKR